MPVAAFVPRLRRVAFGTLAASVALFCLAYLVAEIWGVWQDQQNISRPTHNRFGAISAFVAFGLPATYAARLCFLRDTGAPASRLPDWFRYFVSIKTDR